MIAYFLCWITGGHKWIKLHNIKRGRVDVCTKCNWHQTTYRVRVKK